MNKLMYVICLLSVLFVNPTYAESLKNCNDLTNEVNKQFPTRIDKITTIKSAICYEERKKAKLIYNMVIDFAEAPSMDQKILNTMRPNLTNSLCTNPDFIDLLKMFPISYAYYFDNGKYIGELEFSLKQCK